MRRLRAAALTRLPIGSASGVTTAPPSLLPRLVEAHRIPYRGRARRRRLRWRGRSGRSRCCTPGHHRAIERGSAAAVDRWCGGSVARSWDDPRPEHAGWQAVRPGCLDGRPRRRLASRCLVPVDPRHDTASAPQHVLLPRGAQPATPRSPRTSPSRAPLAGTAPPGSARAPPTGVSATPAAGTSGSAARSAAHRDRARQPLAGQPGGAGPGRWKIRQPCLHREA